MSTTNARTLYELCLNQSRLDIDESIVPCAATNKAIHTGLFSIGKFSVARDHIDCEMQVHNLPIVRGFLEDEAEESLSHDVAVLKRVGE